MSYHTFELRYKVPDYTVIDEALFNGNGKSYMDKKDHNAYIFESLKDKGIIIKRRFVEFGDALPASTRPFYTMLYYKINPRRVMEDNNYVGIFDASGTDEMLDRVNELIYDKYGYELPSADSMKLHRIDFCSNVLMSGQEEVCEYLNLLKRGKIQKGYDLKQIYSETGKRYVTTKNGLTYNGSSGIDITYYNKYMEMTSEKLPFCDAETLSKILRIEIRCGKSKIKHLRKLFNVNTVRDFLNSSDSISGYVFSKYANIFFGSGEFHKLPKLYELIDGSGFKKKTKDAMKELAKETAVHKSLDEGIRILRKEYGKEKVNRILKNFDKINASPIAVSKRSRFEHFENPCELAINNMGFIN
ncbi:MAG: hypothetical protein ACI4SS_01460 [Clostridia bacterium]